MANFLALGMRLHPHAVRLCMQMYACQLWCKYAQSKIFEIFKIANFSP